MCLASGKWGMSKILGMFAATLRDIEQGADMA